MQAKASTRKGDRTLKLKPTKRKQLGSTGTALKREKRQKLSESTPAALRGGDDEDEFGLALEDRDPETDDAQLEHINQDESDSRADGTLSPSTGNSREHVTAEQAAAKAVRRKRDRERRKVKKLSARNWEQAKTISSGIANASLEQQAQWLWESYSGATGASFLEQDGLEESCFARLNSQGSFEERLVCVEEGWAEQLADPSHSEHGSPVVILIASSAIGANNLAKQLPALNKGCRLGKLFAKHFKVAEQQRELDSRCINIATGTPNRMCKLADEGCLRLGRFKLLVLDAALDAKQRSILDIPEVRGDLWLFIKRHIKPLLASGQAKVALIDSSSF